MFGCSGSSDGLAALRVNVGKVACNATNGVYVGRVVDVTMYSAVEQAATPVYVVERDGRRLNAPPSNTIVADDRCADGQPPPESPGIPRPATTMDSPRIDPGLGPVATEFSGRLRTSQGELLELAVARGTITAKWSSHRCDMTEAEVIDFLLSLNHGHSARVTNRIRAERSCGGSMQVFETTGARFEQYRAGRINDAEILRGLR
jgi:hypothetical protein